MKLKILLEELPSPKKSAKLKSVFHDADYVYMTDFKVNGILYSVRADVIDKEKGIWDFHFTTEEGAYEVTGTGNVGKVLSSVLKALIDFTKKVKPKQNGKRKNTIR